MPTKGNDTYLQKLTQTVFQLFVTFDVEVELVESRRPLRTVATVIAPVIIANKMSI